MVHTPDESLIYEVFTFAPSKSLKLREELFYSCTCVLIKGYFNVIVNTMTHLDTNIIMAGLNKHGLKPEDINFVVSTHAQFDYCGNNHLFQKSYHIVGHNIYQNNVYAKIPFIIGKTHYIDGDFLKIVPTPGYTLTDISVVVKLNQEITFAITGELFEPKELLFQSEETIRQKIPTRRRIENPIARRHSRNLIMKLANFIIPGHGNDNGQMFEVTDELRASFLSRDNVIN